MVKADGYGLGARGVVARLAAAGCRDFFLSSWAEATALGTLPDGARLSVLHGVRAEDMETALASSARPVIATPAQAMRWRPTGRPCDVMVDTGINRLGLSLSDLTAGALDGLCVDAIMSHLACADEPAHPLNARQLERFRALPPIGARRSLANSAGAFLGLAFGFDLVRPGLALYGGTPGAVSGVRPVASLEAQVIQVRDLERGETVGYGAAFRAKDAMRLAVLNIGYADGVPHALGRATAVTIGGRRRRVVGRVSMDQLCVDATGVDVTEGDWAAFAMEIPRGAARSWRSQYEVLTGLGARLDRRWT